MPDRWCSSPATHASNPHRPAVTASTTLASSSTCDLASCCAFGGIAAIDPKEYQYRKHALTQHAYSLQRIILPSLTAPLLYNLLHLLPKLRYCLHVA